MKENTELAEDIEGEGTDGVHIKVDMTTELYQIATFDGDERVSQWKAAMQKPDEIWFAEGYLSGKNKSETVK